MVNMDIGMYLTRVDELARECIKRRQDPMFALDDPEPPLRALVDALVGARIEFLTEGERQFALPYLTTGFYPYPTDLQRIAAVSLVRDVEIARDKIDAFERCAPYKSSDPVFRGSTQMFRDTVNSTKELIGFTALTLEGRGSLARFGGGYAALDRALPRPLVDSLIASYASAPLYVRLDPRYSWDSRPAELLTEALTVATRPVWWRDLSIARGEKLYARHDLNADAVLPAEVREYWDYHVRHIRRIEMYIARDRESRLSVLIEELPRINDDTGLMLARCIHLDTPDPPGTLSHTAVLDHLDLALNVYSGADARTRQASTIQHGPRVEASKRVHLLHIAGVPFETVFECVRGFFVASTLADEFIQHQFK